jgi:hypothetical protein
MFLLPLLLASVGWLLFPDPSVSGVKIVTRQVTGASSDTRTEYLTSTRLRSEWQTRIGERAGPPMASIIQRGNTDRIFLLDLQAREFVAYETDSRGMMLGAKQRPVANSGGTLRIWIDNTDTGERQEMFGHVARHIITKEKRIATPGACSRNSESATDGWYIDDSMMPEWHRPKKSGVLVGTLVTVNSSGVCADKMDAIEMHRAGVEPGFPLKITTTMKSEILEREGTTRMVASTWGSEVMEFHEGPLDPALFEVPADFHKVDMLKNWYTPPPRRQLSGWEWFKDKLTHLFE